MKTFRQLKEELLSEKLILLNNGANYGQVLYLVGGAGSGKGFAIDNFFQSEKFKVRDVDEWKKSFLKLSRIKNKYPEIKDLDLKIPGDVAKLHFFVKKLGIKEKTLDLMLRDVSQNRLPNIIFDITGKSMSDFEESLTTLLSVGYKPESIHLAWILANYKVAYTANLKRDRVVPADVFLDTHKGAAATMQKIINDKKLPSGMNGRFVVVLNNRENTIFFKQNNTLTGKPISGVRDFYYIELKKEGKTFKPENEWKKELHKQIVDNVPGGEAGLNSLKLDI